MKFLSNLEKVLMKFIRKTPVLETFLNTVAWMKACKVIKKRLRQRCFPVNIANYLRQLSILKIICEQLLLKVKLNLLKVCKLSSVWLKFISTLFLKVAV